MLFKDLSNHFIVRMYESIRDEALTDDRLGFPLVGDEVRERAEELYQEIEPRGLLCTQIEWPEENTIVLRTCSEGPWTAAGRGRRTSGASNERSSPTSTLALAKSYQSIERRLS
jgi:hypothetical protein